MAADIARRGAASRLLFRIGRFPAASARAVRRIALTLKHRRDIARLAERDDRLLADVGLKRGDLAAARCAPLWQDPTVILSVRVRRRRQSPTAPFHQERDQ